MTELLAKLSSYNIFNYLLPGIIFAVAARKTTRFDFIQENIVVGLFLYYFIGLVISRFGSLIIEPSLRCIKFLNFVDYKLFVAASGKDSKIEILSEVNNMYRTLCSLFVLLLLLKLYDHVEMKHPASAHWHPIGLSAALLIMFLFSYQKQTAYISKRVKIISSENVTS